MFGDNRWGDGPYNRPPGGYPPNRQQQNWGQRQGWRRRPPNQWGGQPPQYGNNPYGGYNQGGNRWGQRPGWNNQGYGPNGPQGQRRGGGLGMAILCVIAVLVICKFFGVI